MSKDWKKTESILKNDGIAVLYTDTIYGIVASAFSKKAIKKIYKIKKRNKSKPLIVLISSLDDLLLFNIKKEEIPSKVFLPKVSVLLKCKSIKFKYIHKVTSEIAFRLIGKKNKNLYNLLKKVGPIVAPSANIEGFKPAESIFEAKKYFGKNVDIYINNGIKKNKASTLVRFKKDKIFILRKGDKIIKI